MCIVSGGDNVIMYACLVNTFSSVMSVGFAEESYTCSESDQEDCKVCITITSPDKVNAELHLPVYIASVSGTATGIYITNYLHVNYNCYRFIFTHTF